jgi:myo-inositol-1(or 4)-monophosphatase
VLGNNASVEQEAFLAAEEWGHEALRIARDVRSQAGMAVEIKRDAFDLTTPADKRIERYLVHAIRQRFPGHAILGEEDGEIPGVDPWRWVIDPIDGTFNFATGLPGSACSVALEYEQEARVGFLADLASGAVVRARRGHGIVNSQPGRTFDPRARDDRGRARLFLETGAEAFDTDTLAALSQLATIRTIVPRVVGSAAIALLSAALKGGTFVGIGLRLWDVAAGVLLAEEAGLLARWWHGEAHLVHVVVGEREEVDAFGPVVAELARRWEPSTARLVPISSG